MTLARGWLALSALALVAGCGGAPPTAPPAVQVTAPEVAAVAPTVQHPPPRRQMMPPSELLHLSAAEVRRKLGPPDFRRQDPPAELWQYRGESCILDLFLYDRDSVLQVTHVETRPGNGIDLTPSGCYATLLNRMSSP